jgi:TolB-like protein
VTVALQQELTRIGGLDVRSQGSSRQFAGTAPSVVEAGRLAGVDLAVVGTVQQTGSSLRVSPQLIQISTDTPIWSDTVTRQLRAPADLFAAIDEITRSIGNRVRLTMRAGRQEPLPDLPTWAQFVEALRLQSRRGPDNVRATEIFQSIVERQPDFAPAWAGLAGVYGERAFSYPSVGGFAIAPAEAFQRIAPAAAKAMVLDGSLPEAHAARGHAHALAGEWEQAEAAFRRALELDPGATTISSDFVITTLMPTARLNEALNVLHLALRRDPLSADAVRVLAYVQLSSGQYDATLENCQRALDLSLQLTYAQEFCMRARVLKGDVADAIAFFETRGEGGEGWLGYAYASAGRRADAEALLKKVEGVPNRQALIYAGLRDASRTMDAIEKMAGVNVIRAASWLTYPEFHFLRDHPLAAEFRLRHRLPPPR